MNQIYQGSAKHAFMRWLDNWSDIEAHLMFLFKNAQGGILELGTRGGISTSAFLYGLELNGGHLWSVDFDPRCADAFNGHPHWTFINADSVDVAAIAGQGQTPLEFDLVFIDTDHVYDRLARELAVWGPTVKQGGLILMHDVLAFPDMARAADEYASSRGFVYKVRPGSNGLGVIHC